MEWFSVPAAYLVGSVQPGLLLVRLMQRRDIRESGSGKTGFTNVLRTAGKPAAALVLVLDAGKGLVVVAGIRMVSNDSWVEASVAAAVMIGHVLPVFAGFRGGRGVATGVGAAAGLVPWSALVGLAAFAPVVLTTRYVSLGSISGVTSVVISFAVGALLLDTPIAYLWFALMCGPMVVWMHRDNIIRLFRGTERRIGQRSG